MTVLRHLPNLITMFRLVLVIPIVVSIYEGAYEIALILFVIAGLSDGLDGWLARWFEWVSPFGKFMDPVADKLLLLATTITLTVIGHFPLMLMFLMIVKDLAIITAIFAYALLAGFPEIRPILIGKSTTTLQMLLIVCIILDLIVQHPWLIASLPVLTWIVACITLLDGIVYLWYGTAALARDARWRGV